MSPTLMPTTFTIQTAARLQLDFRPRTTESDLRLETSDRLLVDVDNLGVDSVLSGRDLIGDIDSLLDAKRSLLNRAVQIGLLGLLAEVGLGVDKADQSVLDNQVDVSALLDGLKDGTGRADNQLAATVGAWMVSMSSGPLIAFHRAGQLGGRVGGKRTPWEGWARDQLW